MQPNREIVTVKASLEVNLISLTLDYALFLRISEKRLAISSSNLLRSSSLVHSVSKILTFIPQHLVLTLMNLFLISKA